MLDWPTLVAADVESGRRWIIAGNIPYNITTPLIARALTPPLPALITFLVQREVAARVTAEPGTKAYGALSIGVQAVAEAQRLFAVSRGAFQPPPRVESALLQLRPRADPLITPDEAVRFREFVTRIFSYRRKRMVHALRHAAKVTPAQAQVLLSTASVDPDARPETLPPAAFAELFRVMGRGGRH